MGKLGTAGGLSGQASAPKPVDAEWGVSRRWPGGWRPSNRIGRAVCREGLHILYPRSVDPGNSAVTEHLGTPLSADPQTPAVLAVVLACAPAKPLHPRITGWAPRSGPPSNPLTFASGRSLMRKRFLLKLSFRTLAQLKALILVKP